MVRRALILISCIFVFLSMNFVKAETFLTAFWNAYLPDCQTGGTSVLYHSGGLSLYNYSNVDWRTYSTAISPDYKWRVEVYYNTSEQKYFINVFKMEGVVPCSMMGFYGWYGQYFTTIKISIQPEQWCYYSPSINSVSVTNNTSICVGYMPYGYHQLKSSIAFIDSNNVIVLPFPRYQGGTYCANITLEPFSATLFSCANFSVNGDKLLNGAFSYFNWTPFYSSAGYLYEEVHYRNIKGETKYICHVFWPTGLCGGWPSRWMGGPYPIPLFYVDDLYVFIGLYNITIYGQKSELGIYNYTLWYYGGPLSNMYIEHMEWNNSEVFPILAYPKPPFNMTPSPNLTHSIFLYNRTSRKVYVMDYKPKTISEFYSYPDNVTQVLNFYCDFSYNYGHSAFPPFCYEIVNLTNPDGTWEIDMDWLFAPLIYPKITITSPQPRTYTPQENISQQLPINFSIRDFPYHQGYGTYCALEFWKDAKYVMNKWVYLPNNTTSYSSLNEGWYWNLTASPPWGFGRYDLYVFCCYDVKSLSECQQKYSNYTDLVWRSVTFYFSPAYSCSKDADCGAYCKDYKTSMKGHCYGGKCEYEKVTCEGVCDPSTGYCAGTIEQCKALAEKDPMLAGYCLSNVKKYEAFGLKFSYFELMILMLIVLIALSVGVWRARK